MKKGLLFIALVFLVSCSSHPEKKTAAGVPQFKVDPYWPKPLPSNWILGQVAGTFGRPGRMAGELRWVHNVAIDSKGNVYTAEVGFGRRAQKFARQP